MKGTGNRQLGTDARDQGPGAREELANLLRKAAPPVGSDAGPGPDLWPAMQRRLSQQEGVRVGLRAVPWFDWALAGGMALAGVAFPTAIPVLLYYL